MHMMMMMMIVECSMSSILDTTVIMIVLANLVYPYYRLYSGFPLNFNFDWFADVNTVCAVLV